MQDWTAHKRQMILSIDSQPRFEAARKNPELFEDPLELRYALLDFIADFSNWANGTNPEYLATSRSLTIASNEAQGGGTGVAPVLLDPFSGGGAIPLEGVRVGADAIASDTNPLALLIEKVVLQYAPQFGERLALEIEAWASSVNLEASASLAKFFPSVDGITTPIVYLWARTVLSEARRTLPLTRTS